MVKVLIVVHKSVCQFVKQMVIDPTGSVNELVDNRASEREIYNTATPVITIRLYWSQTIKENILS